MEAQRRLKTVRQRHRPKDRSGGRPARQFLQLLVCLAILAALLICKAFWPQGAQGIQVFVSQYVASGIDLGRAVEEIGAAFSGRIPFSEVFQNDGETSSGPDPTQQSVPPSEYRVQDRMAAVSALAERGFGKPAYISPSFPASTANAVPLLNELEYHRSPTTLEDDTWPLPFGMVKPALVDFAEYPLPFDYANPLNAPLTSGFGYRLHPIDGVVQFHYGVDLGAAEGTEITAFAQGRVREVGYNAVYGNYILLEHAEGFATFYAHCRAVLSEEGQTVTLGQTIALVGNTGKSTGPHLHFELRRNDLRLNPLQAVAPLDSRRT